MVGGYLKKQTQNKFILDILEEPTRRDTTIRRKILIISAETDFDMTSSILQYQNALLRTARPNGHKGTHSIK